MSNTGALARTDRMTNPDANGNYDISANFYKIVVDGSKSYDMDIIRENFMTPKPVTWSSPAIKPLVQSVAIGGGHILVTAFDAARNIGPLLFSAGSNAGGQLGTDDGVSVHHTLHPVRIYLIYWRNIYFLKLRYRWEALSKTNPSPPLRPA